MFLSQLGLIKGRERLIIDFIWKLFKKSRIWKFKKYFLNLTNFETSKFFIKKIICAMSNFCKQSRPYCFLCGIREISFHQNLDDKNLAYNWKKVLWCVDHLSSRPIERTHYIYAVQRRYLGKRPKTLRTHFSTLYFLRKQCHKCWCIFLKIHGRYHTVIIFFWFSDNLVI